MRPKPGRSYSAENGLELRRICRIADFGRDASVGEAVDEHLAAVRTRCRAGQRLQRVRELVGVVGQGVELLAFDHDRARGLVRGEPEGRRCSR